MACRCVSKSFGGPIQSQMLAWNLAANLGFTASPEGHGLFYNGSSLSVDFSQFHDEQELPFFYPAFYTMSAICILCFLLLLALGVQLIRMKSGAVSLFVLLLIFEVLYTLAIGPMWLLPSVGRSIGAATGVANGGMMFQAFVLFPIWAIPASLWARRKLSESRLELGLMPRV